MSERDPAAIRIFISSTFRDMQLERDLLSKQVFPILRRMCEVHGVMLDEVDLRWGITEQEADRGDTLPLCLAEIERCQPFFVCMLGERYGWVPPEISTELVSRQPWLREHKCESVTALEIMYGALQSKENLKNSLFYFRDPGYVSRLPSEEQSAFREGPTSEDIECYGLPEAESRAIQRIQLLEELKARIRGSGAQVCDGYASPATFARQVARDLARVIKPYLPSRTLASDLDRENAAHAAFARTRSRGYVGDAGERHRLDAFLSDDTTALVVCGNSGSGKSALLASWSSEISQRHPDTLLLTHFVAATPGSTNWEGMVRRFLDELLRSTGAESEKVIDKAALIFAFANALQQVSLTRTVLIIVDAIDQLEDRDGARELAWLPVTFPSRVKLVISTLPGPPLDAARRRHWPAIEMISLDKRRKRKLIREWLTRFSKRLDDRRLRRLVDSPQTASPLFLRTVLEEVRLTGTHDSLDVCLTRYLSASDTSQLFELVLERWEHDYSQSRPGWVRRAMACLWASRKGLSESEILALASGTGAAVPRAYLSRLLSDADALLISRSGLLGFFHRELEEAVRRRYLADESARVDIHQRIAGYFQGHRLGPRVVEELPWQLARAGDWNRLARTLTRRSIFKAMWIRDEYEIHALWAVMERDSDRSVATSYRALIADPARDPDFAQRVAILLNSMGHPREALLVFQKLEKLYRRSGDTESLAFTRGNIAITQMSLGDNDAAFRTLSAVEKQARSTGDQPRLITALSNMTEILITRGQVGEAEALCREQERLCRERHDIDGLFRSLGKQGHLLCLRGQREQAMVLFQEAEMMCRQVGDRAGVAAALTDQAFVLRSSGNLSQAMDRYREAETIARSVHAPQQLHGALGGQATIWEMQGDAAKALALYEEAERVGRMTHNHDATYRALHHRSLIIAESGDAAQALELQQEVENICRNLGDKHGLYRSLGCQGLMQEQLGNLDAALLLAIQAGTMSEELGDIDGTIGSLMSQAGVLAEQEKHEAASSLYVKAIRLSRTLDDPYRLARALLSYAAFICDVLKAFENARPFADEALLLARRFMLKDVEEDAVALLRQGRP